jgi:hypothetical protein
VTHFWNPGSARGYSVANSYLLTHSDAALLIDTGFGKDEPVIRAQIESMIVPKLPLSMFPLRLNEFMSINNVDEGGRRDRPRRPQPDGGRAGDP